MYERFTDRARKIMQLANQEAQQLKSEYVEPEHLLLALVAEGSGVAAHVLLRLGIDLPGIRAEVRWLARMGVGSTADRLPLSRGTKQVLQDAREEAREFSHNYVGGEHLLLGLLRQHDGVALLALGNMGVTAEIAETETFNFLGLGLNSVPRAPRIRRRLRCCNPWRIALGVAGSLAAAMAVAALLLALRVLILGR